MKFHFQIAGESNREYLKRALPNIDSETLTDGQVNLLLQGYYQTAQDAMCKWMIGMSSTMAERIKKSQGAKTISYDREKHRFILTRANEEIIRCRAKKAFEMYGNE